AQRCRYARRRLLFSASPEKSNQKRGDFFRRSNLFLYGNCGGGMGLVPFPATYCGGSGKRFRCAARRGAACRGVGGSGKAATCRELPSGANRKDVAATIAAAHCAAIRCVSRRGEDWRCGGCVLTAQGIAPLPQQSL
ncbi:MAG: hypothetical protein LBO63_02140, partial [Oscillospiraceae bacterium]|nr:hypothetical protein [Oscillospiraceae bacterium]